MPSPAYERSRRELAPAGLVLDAIEITHPDLPDPARAVNDVRERLIEGNRFPGLPFRARVADAADGRVPSAEITVDNVGRDLTQWVEAANGGTGATVRMMQVLADGEGGATVEWDMHLDVLSSRVNQQVVAFRLGFDPLLGRPAVLYRHDPERSAGLF